MPQILLNVRDIYDDAKSMLEIQAEQYKGEKQTHDLKYSFAHCNTHNKLSTHKHTCL